MSFNSMKLIHQLSFGEEVANTITHGVMSLFALFALPFAAIYAYLQGGFYQAFGVSIFGISIFMMLLVSTLYHAMAYNTNHKVIFRILDHIFIYVAIAGTYTPIAITLIQGWQGALILIIQWAMVLIGIFYKSLANRSMPALSLTIYLIMGWIAILFLPAILAKSSIEFMGLILLGGIFYSIGAYFYALQNKHKYYHMIWHLFINLAVIAHYVAIVFFLASHSV